MKVVRCRRLLLRRCIGNANALRLLPFHISFEVFPHALQAPQHIHLSKWKMFDETVKDKLGDMTPAAVPAISHLLKKYCADGNKRSECISIKHDLQKNGKAQRMQQPSCGDRQISQELHRRFKEFIDPEIRKHDPPQ